MARQKESAETTALKAARELLLGRYESLRAQATDARERRAAILHELQCSEAELKAIQHRMESLEEVLSLEVAEEDSDDEPYRAAGSLPIAIDKLLAKAEFGGEDPLEELDAALEGRSPLLKLAPQLWSRAAWGDEVRHDIPGKKTKSGN